MDLEMYELSRQLVVKRHKHQPITNTLHIIYDYDNDNLVEVRDIFLRLLRECILRMFAIHA